MSDTPDPYNERVRRHFANPAHAGSPTARYALQCTAQAAESAQGCRIELHAGVTDGVLRSLRYRVFGCPHLVAAAEETCRQLENQPVAMLQSVDIKALLATLDVPVEKTGRILLLEDALRALCSTLEREQTGSADDQGK